MKPSKSINIIGLQINLEWENPSENVRKIQSWIEPIEGADLIVLPEMFSTGFSMNAKTFALENEIVLNWMKECSLKKGLALCGSLSIEENGNYFNRFYFIEGGEIKHSYDKRHLFSLAKEEDVYSAGSERLIFSFKGWRICPLICYDLRFPVWSRNREEYDLLLYVANWPERRILAWDTLLRARAIENMAIVVGINRVGLDGNGIEHCGHSVIIDAMGTTIAQIEPWKEGALEAELTKEGIEKARKKFGFLEDRDDFICPGLPEVKE